MFREALFVGAPTPTGEIFVDRMDKIWTLSSVQFSAGRTVSNVGGRVMSSSASEGSYEQRCSGAVAGSSTDKDLCRVFVSYSHIDEAERVRLDVHLAPLACEGLINLWCNRVIAPGSDWRRDIENEIENADIVILLVTADFVASLYCFEKELSAALRRQREGGVRIVPVLVKPVDFAHMPFGRFQALPRDLRPISTWDDADAGWLEVALGVRELVEDIYRSRNVIPNQRAKPRREVDKSLLGRQLSDYYGASSCVVDGPVAEDRGIEWIPLDEDSSGMRFDNLVPISSRHRDRSLRFGGGTLQRATFRFGIDLIAENVFHSARRHFHAGSPALAFGCARLGDALAVHYPYLFETHEGDDWAFLAQSLFYLPYRMHQALLEGTLQRVRQRLEASDCCPNGARAGLLLAIANLYQDIGLWAQAERLYERILTIGPPPSMHADVLRRRAAGRLLSGVNHDSMDREFRSIVKYKANADTSVSLAVVQGWWCLLTGRPERCLRELAPFDFDEEAPIPAPMYSPRTAIELKLVQAAAYTALGLSCGPQLSFVRQHSRNRLRPVFTEYMAPLVLDEGFDDVLAPLRDRQVVVPGLLDATADSVLAARGVNVSGRPIWVD
jgi:hypothetical protein